MLPVRCRRRSKTWRPGVCDSRRSRSSAGWSHRCAPPSTRWDEIQPAAHIRVRPCRGDTVISRVLPSATYCPARTPWRELDCTRPGSCDNRRLTRLAESNVHDPKNKKPRQQDHISGSCFRREMKTARTLQRNRNADSSKVANATNPDAAFRKELSAGSVLPWPAIPSYRGATSLPDWGCRIRLNAISKMAHTTSPSISLDTNISKSGCDLSATDNATPRPPARYTPAFGGLFGSITLESQASTKPQTEALTHEHIVPTTEYIYLYVTISARTQSLSGR